MEKLLFVLLPDLCDGEDFKVLDEGMGTLNGNPCVEKIIALNCSIELFSEHIIFIAESMKYCNKYQSQEEIVYWNHLAVLADCTEDDMEAPRSLYRKACKVCGVDIEADVYVYLQWMSV